MARKAYFERPEFRAAQEKSRSFGAKLVGDNQFLANEVQPGQYTFSVFVYERIGTNGSRNLIPIDGEVPVTFVPAGQAATPIDSRRDPTLQPVQ